MGCSAVAVTVKALRRAGKEPSRTNVVAALDAMSSFDQKIGPKSFFQSVGAGDYARRGQTGIALMELKVRKFISLGSYIDPVKRRRIYFPKSPRPRRMRASCG